MTRSRIYVHDGEHPSFLLRRFHDSVPDLVSDPPDAFIPLFNVTLSQEPLKECAVDAMHRHHVEVALHSFGVAG